MERIKSFYKFINEDFKVNNITEDDILNCINTGGVIYSDIVSDYPENKDWEHEKLIPVDIEDGMIMVDIDGTPHYVKLENIKRVEWNDKKKISNQPTQIEERFLINEKLEIQKELADLLELLYDKKDKVATYILRLKADSTSLITFPNDFIDFGKDLNELSFIASNRIDINDYPKNFIDTRRQSIRTGRLIRKIISDVPKNVNTITYTGEFYIMEDEVIIPDSSLPPNYDDIIEFIYRMGGVITIKGTGIGKFKEKERKKTKDEGMPWQGYYNTYGIEKKFKAKDLKNEIEVDSKYRLGWHLSSIDKSTKIDYGFLSKSKNYLAMTVIPVNVDEIVDGPSSTNYGPMIKITDIKGDDLPITKLTGTVTVSTTPNITDADIEKFVNEFLAIRKSLDFDSAGLEFKIVKGEDIRKYYSHKSYFGFDINLKKGDLWNSCMRHEFCQKYFDMYTDNPDQVQMLILTTPDDKLLGRALIWTLDEPKETFLDRIYAINDADQRLFINYAIKEGWAYRDKDAEIWKDNKKFEDGLKITLKNKPRIRQIGTKKKRWYPYLDTLSYYDVERNSLANSNIIGYDRILSNTHGAWGNADPSELDPEYEN